MKSLGLALALAAVLLLAGCAQPNVCTSSDGCAGFECDLECEHEKLCVAGKCECRCIQKGDECVSAADCAAKKCGIPPNKAECRNGFCKCRYECERTEDCSSFECLIECYPNYNYCEGGACTCACEHQEQEYSPWQVNELKEDLEGKIIKVKGTARAMQQECSEEECEGECCQACTAKLELYSAEGGEATVTLGGTLEGSEVGCTGSECGLECRPLKTGNVYLVEGIWKKAEGEYLLEAIGYTLLEEGKAEFKPKKSGHAAGEEVIFTLSFGRELFLQSWDTPAILKQDGDSWTEYLIDCGCVPECGSESEVCEENYLECGAKDSCSKANPDAAWIWNQQLCRLKGAECEWGADPLGEKPKCGDPFNAGPGTYKARIAYVEDCAKPLEKTSVESGEFTIT